MVYALEGATLAVVLYKKLMPTGFVKVRHFFFYQFGELGRPYGLYFFS